MLCVGVRIGECLCDVVFEVVVLVDCGDEVLGGCGGAGESEIEVCGDE